MRVVLITTFSCLTTVYGWAASAGEPFRPLVPVQIYEVQKPFLDDNGTAKDLSGAACLPPGAVRRLHCLAINDEGRAAQLFTVDGGHIEAGLMVPIIGEKPSTKTLGAKPSKGCCPEGDGKFKELDGEGVAYAPPYFYIAGSHGCSRHSSKFRLSSFILARIPVDGSGNPIKQAESPSNEEVSSSEKETTYRLADALRAAPNVGPFFLTDLNTANGLNVEGIAVLFDRVVVGLRAPSIDDRAFLVSARVDDLFAHGNEPLAVMPQVIPIHLGQNVGVRDLAPLPNGQLLVLAGPAQEQPEIPYSLFTVDPKVGGEVKRIATLTDVVDDDGERAKAEAVTVLDPDDLRLLVFFDGLENGGPREYAVPK